MVESPLFSTVTSSATRRMAKSAPTGNRSSGLITIRSSSPITKVPRVGSPTTGSVNCGVTTGHSNWAQSPRTAASSWDWVVMLENDVVFSSNG